MAGSAAASKGAATGMELSVYLCPYRIRTLNFNLSLSRALSYVFYYVCFWPAIIRGCINIPIVIKCCIWDSEESCCKYEKESI